MESVETFRKLEIIFDFEDGKMILHKIFRTTITQSLHLL